MCKNSSVKKQLSFIKLLLALPCSKRGRIIKQCRRPQIEAISEIVLNFLKQNLTSDKKIINSLKPFKGILHKLILKKTSLIKKKKLLSSRRGAGILSILLPLVGTVFGLMKG